MRAGAVILTAAMIGSPPLIAQVIFLTELPDPRRKQPATVSGGGNGYGSVSVRVSSHARYPLHSRLPVSCVSDLAALI